MTLQAASDQKKLCFVIGPIGDAGTDVRRHADFLLHGIIHEAISIDDHDIRRADQDTDPGNINTKLIQDIIKADLVVADLTFLNANAMYELGIRHTTLKPTIHVAAAGTELPFDNSQQRTIFFHMADWNSIVAARSQLKEMVRKTETHDFIVTNPYSVAGLRTEIAQSDDPIREALSQLADRMDEMNVRVNNMTSAMHENGLPTRMAAPLHIYSLPNTGHNYVGETFLSNAAKMPLMDIISEHFATLSPSEREALLKQLNGIYSVLGEQAKRRSK